MKYHKAHYSRAILLHQNAAERARQLEEIKLTDGTSLLDHVENRPLEVLGNYVAYPAADPKWHLQIKTALAQQETLAVPPDERLATLPTRGVFAEAHLGHCNSSEEIDNTRFWDWQQSPIPHLAPEIAPVQPVTPQPQQQNVQPTPFPQSLVNIVNPPNAPDPTGLAAALNVLGTPNIFRDMSGRQEVADLLKKLSDNTISIAEAANHAKDIQTKYGTNLDKQQKDYDLGIYKATADLAGKAVEVEAQRAAQAQASKAEAEAKKANVAAATQQAEAAKSLPKPLRDPVYKDAANALAGNPTKNKVVVFKAIGYNGMILDGIFTLTVRDVLAQKNVIANQKVAQSFAQNISFETAEPVVEAQVSRAIASYKIFDEVITLPAIDIVPRKDSYTVGKSHKVINLTLTQASSEVSFKATSSNGAVNELMNKWGGEIGIDKVVAAKLVAEYEKKNQITHTKAEEKSYSFKVPTQNYELILTSH